MEYKENREDGRRKVIRRDKDGKRALIKKNNRSKYYISGNLERNTIEKEKFKNKRSK
jgi:hypothetical protein